MDMDQPKSKHKYIRVYKEFEPDEVKKQLLMIDDLYGTCANCGQLGLTFVKDKTCPGCKTTFAYLITKLKNPGDVSKILARIKSEGLSLMLLEKDDYDRSAARDALGDLFSKSNP